MLNERCCKCMRDEAWQNGVPRDCASSSRSRWLAPLQAGTQEPSAVAVNVSPIPTPAASVQPPTPSPDRLAGLKVYTVGELLELRASGRVGDEPVALRGFWTDRGLAALLCTARNAPRRASDPMSRRRMGDHGARRAHRDVDRGRTFRATRRSSTHTLRRRSSRPTALHPAVHQRAALPARTDRRRGPFRRSTSG